MQVLILELKAFEDEEYFIVMSIKHHIYLSWRTDIY